LTFTPTGTPTNPESATFTVTGSSVVAVGLSGTVRGSAISLIQSTSCNFEGSVTTGACAFTNPNVAGDFIGVVIRAGAIGETFTCSDTNGNSYTLALSVQETVDDNELGICYAPNIAAGPNTITVSDTMGNTLRFAVLEYTNVATSSPVDGTPTGAIGAGTAASSGNVTTTVNGDLLLGGVLNGNAQTTVTAGTSYTIEQFMPASPQIRLIAEDQIQTTHAAVSATATLGATDNWAAGLVAFKQAGSTPAPPSGLSIFITGP
jgi:hypothetical protein